MRRFASKRERELLLELYDGRCAICGRKLGSRFDVDHLIRFSKQGRTSLCNMQPLCVACHSEKSRAEDS